MVSVEQDTKGSAWMVSHVRCGYTECIFLTADELRELGEILNELKDAGII